MASQNPGLPEGTDRIINGAGVGGEESIGSTGPADAGATVGGGSDLGGTGATTGGAGGSSSGFVATGQGSDDTGGAAGGAGGGGVRDQLRQGVASLQGQAGDRIRTFADSGKGRATDALDEISRVVEETAETIDERLGVQYGDVARRAAESVSSLATTLRGKEVDDLLEDARDIVRKSPAVAIGAAAIVGFALVRLVKSGLDAGSEGNEAGGRGGKGGGNA